MIKLASLNTLYKIGILVGIILTAATLFFAYRHYLVHEQTGLEMAETITLTNLELQSLSQQLTSLEAAIQQTPYKGPSESEATQQILQYSEYEKQKLRAEVTQLQKQISIAAAKSVILEKAKIKLRRTFMLFLGTVIAITVTGSLLSILGCLGWIYHVRIYRDRRQQERNSRTQAKPGNH